MSDLRHLYARKAELLRELADLEVQIPDAIVAATAPQPPDEVLGLDDAAKLMNEPAGTFRQRPCYRRALVSGPRERRLRFSRRALERIKADRLRANDA
jgi:hypothetical protein